MSSLTTKNNAGEGVPLLGGMYVYVWRLATKRGGVSHSMWRLMQGLADGGTVVLFSTGARTFPPFQRVQSIRGARSASYAVDGAGFLPVTK
jgi:hypothetical protein